jgi:hypothetical protein
MRGLTPTLTAAAAAGLTALVITVSAPASGGDNPPDKEVTTVEHHESNTTPQELQTCLRDHGATGVPGDEREGRALKEWIVEHQDDQSARTALKACDVYFDGQKPGAPGPSGKPDCGPVDAEKGKAAAAAKRKGRATAVRRSPTT